jgi:hypothetical protein
LAGRDSNLLAVSIPDPLQQVIDRVLPEQVATGAGLEILHDLPLHLSQAQGQDPNWQLAAGYGAHNCERLATGWPGIDQDHVRLLGLDQYLID